MPKLSIPTRNNKIDGFHANVTWADERARIGDHEYAAGFYRWASQLAGDLAYDSDLPADVRLAWADRSNMCALKWTQHLEAHRGA